MNNAQNEVVAWIGSGVMGTSMVRRLRAAGHEVLVYSRTRAKAEPLIAEGACWVGSAVEAAAEADVVFSMVGYPSDVEQVYLGRDGMLADTGSLRANLFVDMTTSSPALAKKISERAQELNCLSLDAPVSGGDIGAKAGTLSIMVGGSNEAFERAAQYFDKLGRICVLQGGAGAGQHTKMVNQILIATNMIGMCEGLLYAERAGLDPRQVLESVGQGAAGSWSVSNLAPRILNEDFEPGFYVEHFVKDMQIALDSAAEMNLPLPGLALARQFYEAVKAQGMGRKGTQALYLALKRLGA